jgi:hypothetical protein
VKFIKIPKIGLALVIAVELLIGGCSGSGDNETPLPESKKISDVDVPKFEGSQSKSDYSGKQSVATPDETHPGVKKGVKINRVVIVPQEVESQWKAVKIRVLNKIDESKNSMKIVSLGESFKLNGTTIKVIVGPFLPNFVMTQKNYSSKGNELTNPAVRLIVEENGKTLYEGWAFAKYPTMYAFEHDEFALQLMDYIPADVS